MRLKAVPPPPESADTLAEAARAVGRVPAPEGDCCRRVGDRLEVVRDEARTWLTFLRALGLVRQARQGFVRTDRDPTGAATAQAFTERVFGAREVGETLAGGTTAEAAFEAVAEAVPAWERERREDWRAFWRERTRRLLGWAVLFGVAERDGKGFTPGPAYGRP